VEQHAQAGGETRAEDPTEPADDGRRREVGDRPAAEEERRDDGLRVGVDDEARRIESPPGSVMISKRSL